jgi:hypothetical protein
MLTSVLLELQQAFNIISEIDIYVILEFLLLCIQKLAKCGSFVT